MPISRRAGSLWTDIEQRICIAFAASQESDWRRVIVRSCQYLTNLVEQDHRAIKRRVSAMLGFKTFGTATTTLMGIELAHRIRKRQLSIGYRRGQRYGSLAGA